MKAIWLLIMFLALCFPLGTTGEVTQENMADQAVVGKEQQPTTEEQLTELEQQIAEAQKVAEYVQELANEKIKKYELLFKKFTKLTHELEAEKEARMVATEKLAETREELAICETDRVNALEMHRTEVEACREETAQADATLGDAKEALTQTQEENAELERKAAGAEARHVAEQKARVQAEAALAVAKWNASLPKGLQATMSRKELVDTGLIPQNVRGLAEEVTVQFVLENGRVRVAYMLNLNKAARKGYYVDSGYDTSGDMSLRAYHDCFARANGLANWEMTNNGRRLAGDAYLCGGAIDTEEAYKMLQDVKTSSASAHKVKLTTRKVTKAQKRVQRPVAQAAKAPKRSIKKAAHKPAIPKKAAAKNDASLQKASLRTNPSKAASKKSAASVTQVLAWFMKETKATAKQVLDGGKGHSCKDGRCKYTFKGKTASMPMCPTASELSIMRGGNNLCR